MNMKPRLSDLQLSHANFQPYSIVGEAGVFRMQDELPSTPIDAQPSPRRSDGGRWRWERRTLAGIMHALKPWDIGVTPLDNHSIDKATMMDRQNPEKLTSSVPAYRWVS